MATLHRVIHSTAWVTLLLVACQTTAVTDDPVTDNPVDTDDVPLPGDDIVFYGDLELTLDNYCMRCHRDGGGAPMSFVEYDDAKLWGAAMVAAIDRGHMPPPASDPNCRDYVESDLLVISDAEKQRVRDWVAAGTPAGDPADDLPPSNNRFELPDANLEIKIAAPYEPTYSDAANPGNEYRCFTIDHDRDERFFVTAIHALIDKHEISHHMLLGKAPRDSELAQQGRAAGGVDCNENAMVAVEGGFMHAWAPGQSPLRFNAGVGLSVSSDESFILQMHYFKSSEDVIGLTDQPGYAMVTADSVATPAEIQTFGPTTFVIPPGDPDYTFDASQRLRSDVTIHAVLPHMHQLGVEYSMSAGDQCIAEGRYDFDNQMFYYFNEPVTASAGSDMSVSCTWNNSSGTTSVGYGENTEDEMCFAFAMVSY